VPTPTPNSDLKAALLVFREVVKTWMDSASPTAAMAGRSPPPTSGAPNPAEAAMSANPVARQALAGTSMLSAPMLPALDEPMSADAGRSGLVKPPGGWPSLATAALSGRLAPPQPPALPAFGAIVADDFPPLPLPSRAPSAAAVAYGGPEIRAGAPSQTPPPYAGAPTHAQAAAQPGLPPGSDPRAIGHRLLTETGAALARTELLQIASLPEAPAAGRPAEEPGARWVFDMPFQTPQGPAVAQFEISRDGGGGGGEGGRQMGRTWRARFSLDVEPMGPVHAQVALTGDRARVSLWAERPASMARLRGGEARLDAALREAALEPEVAFHAGQPRTAAAAPGQFLDQAT
jgi:hypothetical protein